MSQIEELRNDVFPNIQNHKALIPISDQGWLGFILAIETRLTELAALYHDVHEQQLLIPESMRPAATRWRGVQQRFEKGDERWSAEEFVACCELAEWTVEMRAILKGLPIRKIDWKGGMAGNINEAD